MHARVGVCVSSDAHLLDLRAPFAEVLKQPRCLCAHARIIITGHCSSKTAPAQLSTQRSTLGR
jgi:hypothetical protein